MGCSGRVKKKVRKISTVGGRPGNKAKNNYERIARSFSTRYMRKK